MKNGISGRRLRKLAYQIYKLNKICFSCESKIKCCVHHIDGDRKNNSVGNFQILCSSCHMCLHHEARPHKETSKLKMSKSAIKRMKKYKLKIGGNKYHTKEVRLKMSLFQKGKEVSKGVVIPINDSNVYLMDKKRHGLSAKD